MHQTALKVENKIDSDYQKFLQRFQSFEQKEDDLNISSARS